MAGLYAFYIKKSKTNSATFDSNTKWGIVCKELPFKLIGDAKDVVSRSWPDQHGDDEYLPDVLPIKAYDMTVEFAYKGAPGTANTKIKEFLHYLTGMDNSGVEFSVYDTYTKIGRQKIRFMSYEPTSIYRREGDLDVIVFKVKLKINDPVTDITLSL